ncbi:MAG: ABC transporter ATP-binding protein, partial [Pseudomonadota bacterium]
MARSSAVSRLLRPVRTTLIIACVLQGISAVAGIAPFIAVVEIARVLLADEGSTAAITIAIVAAGALALRFVCMMAAGAMTHLADADLQLLIRRDIAARLRRVPLSWFTTQTGGALKKAIQDDVTALHEIVGHTFVNLTAALVTPLTALAYLGWVDPLLIPVALILPVAGLTPYFLQMRGYGDKMTAFDAAQAEVNAAAVEYVQGIGVIKTFSGPDRAFSRFVERSEAFVTYFWNWIKDLLALATATDLILSPFAAIVAAGGLGLWLASMGWISPVAALALVVMTPALTAPFLALGFAQNAMMQAKDAAKRIDALLDTPVLSAP